MGDRVLKICLVSPLPPPLGGIGRWTTLVNGWMAERSNVTITQIDTSPRWRAIDDTGGWRRKIGGSLQFIRDIIRLNRALITTRFAAIHLTTSGSFAVFRDVGILLNALLFRTPVVYHIHFGRIPEIAGSTGWEWWLIAWVANRVAKVIVIDRATFTALAKHLPGANLVLLPNCLQLSGLPNPARIDRPFRQAVFVGWVVPTKGISELVEAWGRANLQGWQLLIAGPGDSAYQQEVVRRFSPEQIEFLGELPHHQALELIAACDLFVLPSYTEGFPNVILEAMALGKAIVATDVGAIPEMLEGECGILVKPREVEALVDTLQMITANDAQRTAMGHRAQKRARQNYSTDVVFGQLLNIWENARK